MSVKIMSRVWESDHFSGGELIVMLAIADYSNDEGIAWPSIKSLSKKSRLSERQTQKIIKKLEYAHFLEIDRQRFNETNTYRIIVERNCRCSDDVGGCQNDTGGVSPTTPGGVAHDTQSVIEPSLSTSLPIILPSKSTKMDSKSKRTPMMINPTLEEVELAAAKIGLPNIEAQKFFHYYESKGWKVGKSRMVSFRSALSGWKLNWIERTSGDRSSRYGTTPTAVKPKTWAERETLKMKQELRPDQ